jgi:hypothetical protein
VKADSAPRIQSFAEMAAQVPKSWRNAEVAVGRLGSHHPVRRIALHRDADGRRVIVVYDEPLDFAPPAAEPEPEKRNP